MLALGISAFYHDSAAALLRDDEILAAAQEERFTRAKTLFWFPSPCHQILLGGSDGYPERRGRYRLLRQTLSQI